MFAGAMQAPLTYDNTDDEHFDTAICIRKGAGVHVCSLRTHTYTYERNPTLVESAEANYVKCKSRHIQLYRRDDHCTITLVSKHHHTHLFVSLSREISIT